jgi:hypothetical protein
MDAENPAPEVSRRKLLKRAGVGAAALWAVPLVATTGAAQAAPGTAKCAKKLYANGEGCTFCGPFTQCGKSGQFNECDCFPTTEGCCFCAEVVYCKEQLACQSSSDCPAGWACLITCCVSLYGYAPQCTPPCGYNKPRTGSPASGQTNTGRRS